MACRDNRVVVPGQEYIQESTDFRSCGDLNIYTVVGVRRPYQGTVELGDSEAT